MTINLKSFFVLFATIAAVIIFYNVPFSFRSIVKECDNVFAMIESKITERQGVFTSISKNYEEKVFLGTRYKKGMYRLELLPEVDREKFWYGFEKDLDASLKVKLNVLEAGLTVSLYKERLLIGVVTLTSALRAPPPKKETTRKPPKKETKSEPVQTLPKKQSVPKLTYPVSERPVRVEPIVTAPPAPSRLTKGKIAFIIDDVGNTREYEDLFLALPREVTPAILPKLSHSEYFARLSHQRGHDVMLHLPMQAESNLNPGPGAIFTYMRVNEVLAILRDNLASVPYVVGVNNHMGSECTQNEGIMRTVLSELKGRGLFFLDSYTSANSVVEPVMKELRMPYFKRNVFLDNKSDPEYIKGQIRELIVYAKANKEAIGIGHYRGNTFRAIIAMLPEIEREGLELVKVRELL